MAFRLEDYIDEKDKKHQYFKDVISKEDLDAIKHLSVGTIAKKLKKPGPMVLKSLAYHGLYHGKFYRIECLQCKSLFIASYKEAKYCSNKCKLKNPWNKNLTKNDHPTIMQSSIRIKTNPIHLNIDHSKSNKIELILPITKIKINYGANSKLEKAWLLQIDAQPGVKSIKNCDFYIPYINNMEKDKQYYPDFIVEFETGLKWLVEIKGEISAGDMPKIVAARKWAKEYGYHYRLITTGMVHRSDWTFVFAEPKDIWCPSEESIFMSSAVAISYRSISNRLRVGCVITSFDGSEIMGYGFNGDERGGSNLPCSHQPGQDGFIHAEENALLKVKNKQDAKMFLTDMPCINCAKRIINSNFIKEIYYLRPYRDNSGVGLLINAGISVYHFQLVDHVGIKYSDEIAFKKLTPAGFDEY